MDLLVNIAIELFSVIIGFILGQVSPRLNETQWWKNRRARRAFEQVQKAIPSRLEGDYRWNAFEVNGITPIFAFMLPDVAMTWKQVNTYYENEPKSIPPEIEFLRTSYLPKFKDHCKASGKKYHDDPTYSLDQVVVNRVAKESGRMLTLDLHLSPSQFSTFAMANLALDKPLLELGESRVSIREKYGLTSETFDPYHLERVPLHLRFGTNTVLVTKDNLVILPIRSPRQAIAPGSDSRHPVVHVVGEGMLRPTDSTKTGAGEFPNPFITVRRALRDELCLEEMTHYSSADIRFLAILFDFQRYEPIGVFTLRLAITAPEFEEIWRFARDSDEHVGMAYLPYNPEEIRKLSDGEAFFRGNRLILASNHAKMSLFLTLFYYHPFSSIERAFEKR